jgi:hypothetical protein
MKPRTKVMWNEKAKENMRPRTKVTRNPHLTIAMTKYRDILELGMTTKQKWNMKRARERSLTENPKMQSSR